MFHPLSNNWSNLFPKFPCLEPRLCPHAPLRFLLYAAHTVDANFFDCLLVYSCITAAQPTPNLKRRTQVLMHCRPTVCLANTHYRDTGNSVTVDKCVAGNSPAEAAFSCLSNWRCYSRLFSTFLLHLQLLTGDHGWQQIDFSPLFSFATFHQNCQSKKSVKYCVSSKNKVISV